MLPRIVPQAIQTKSVYDFSGGYHGTDSQFIIGDNEVSDGLNMTLGEDGRWLGRGGFFHFGVGVPSGVGIEGMKFFLHTPTATKIMVVASSSDVYLCTNPIISGGIAEWTAQSQGLTIAATYAYFTYKDDLLYMVNGKDISRKYNHSTTTWTNLTNFPVTAAGASDHPSGITHFKSRLIAWSTVNFPRRVYYSDAGTETVGASNYFDLDDTVLHCEVVNDDFMLVFTASAVFRINTFIFSGTTFNPDKIDKISTLRLRNRNGIAQRDGVVFFPTLAGVFQTDGVITQNISKKQVPALGYIGTNYDFTVSSACVFMNYYVISTATYIFVYDILRRVWFVPHQKAGGDETAGYSYMVPVVGIFTADVLFLAHTDKNQILMSYHLFEQDESYAEFNYDHFYAAFNLNTSDADILITGSTSTRAAQSFQVTSATVIDSVELTLAKSSGTTTELTIRIETNNAGVPSGTLAHANATTTLTAFSTGYLYKRALFANTFTLSASTTYWMVVQHTTEGSGTSVYKWAVDQSSPTYASGNAATYASGSWTADATKDFIFSIIGQIGYAKWIKTKEFPLSDPQRNKKIKKIWVDIDEETEAQTVTVNLYNQNSESSKAYTIDTSSVNNPHSVYLKGQNFKSRRFSLQFYNATIKENFTLTGFQINYSTVNTLK